ncbi:cytidine deaminase [Holophaga foetida]|uniref:cytidine deaminase n=1 Tax=Holophaga foetida TaxID=35839 RepID=UPI000247370D|nr:cytidine deaminase [Holophaga foetida]
MPYEDAQSPEWEPLLGAAWEAWGHAYAPYSRFKVGAALAFPGGRIVTGCNVENASYPVGLCAERGAISAAVAQGLRLPGPIALVVVTEAETLTPPCGACRQVLAEFSAELLILLANRRERVIHRLGDLLPYAFTGRHLGILD